MESLLSSSSLVSAGKISRPFSGFRFICYDSVPYKSLNNSDYKKEKVSIFFFIELFY